MSLIAEFDLSSPQLPLTDIAAAVPDLELRVEDVLTTEQARPVLVCWADGEGVDVFKTALETEAAVATHNALGATGTRSLYRIELNAEAPPIHAEFVKVETAPIEATITPTGWRVRARFANRRALARFYQSCRSYGISFQLDRLYEATATPERDDEFGLTPKQRETLSVAHEMGYFAIPRTTSMEAIGEQFGISPPSVSERLRRAQDRLIRHTIRLSE